MNEQQTANLRRLWQIIRNQPEETLHLNCMLARAPGSWRVLESLNPTLQEPCGTIFCIFGAAALSGEFKGLSFRKDSDRSFELLWQGARCAYASMAFCDATQKLFGLDPELSFKLFGPKGEPSPAESSKQQALRRFEELFGFKEVQG